MNEPIRRRGQPEWSDPSDPSLQRARAVASHWLELQAMRRAVPLRDAPHGFGRVTNYTGRFDTFTLYYSKPRLSPCKDLQLREHDAA